MKVIGYVCPDVKRLVNFILRHQGDCENFYNKREWYGKPVSCMTLHASYGAIGYDMEYNGHSVVVDNEMDTITIDDGEWEEYYRGNTVALKRGEWWFYLMNEDEDIAEFGPYESIKDAKRAMDKELRENKDWLRD